MEQKESGKGLPKPGILMIVLGMMWMWLKEVILFGVFDEVKCRGVEGVYGGVEDDENRGCSALRCG